MNCARFQDLLFEHLDGELSPDEQALVAEHLAGCPECRSLMERKKAAGAWLTKAFHDRTAGLRLSSGFERRVLEGLEAEAPATAVRMFDALSAIVRRFALPAAAVMVVTIFLVRGHAPRDAVHHMSVQTGGDKVPTTVPVQAMIVSTVYTFRLEGDRVVDRVEYRTNVVDGAVLLSRN
jgi:anti-sigma factor RsiW